MQPQLERSCRWRRLDISCPMRDTLFWLDVKGIVESGKELVLLKIIHQFSFSSAHMDGAERLGLWGEARVHRCATNRQPHS